MKSKDIASSSQFDLAEFDLTGSSLGELESALRTLRSVKSARKRAGSKWVQSVLQKWTNIVRIEIPLGTDHIYAQKFAEKLVSKDTDWKFELVENPRLTAGIRVFEGDQMYDGSFSTLMQKI